MLDSPSTEAVVLHRLASVPLLATEHHNLTELLDGYGTLSSYVLLVAHMVQYSLAELLSELNTVMPSCQGNVLSDGHTNTADASLYSKLAGTPTSFQRTVLEEPRALREQQPCVCSAN